MTSRKPLIVAAVAVAYLIGTAPAQQADVRFRKKGTGAIETVQRVKIQEESYRGIRATKGAQRYNWSPADVVEIRYKQAPTEFKAGLAAFKEGDYELTVQKMDAALAGGKRYAWLPAYVGWYKAEALRRYGDLNAAAQAYDALLKGSPNCRFVPAAYEALAKTALARGEAGGSTAKRNFEKLKDIASREKLPERYTLLADLGTATVEARFGDANKGLDQLKAVLRKAEKKEESVANQSRLEIGNTYIRQKSYQQAQTYFERIESQMDQTDPDPMLIAGAANGLADTHYHQGRFSEAGVSYSKVYALFIDRGELRDQVAHALYFGGESFDRQAGDPKNAEAKRRLYRKRAKSLWRRAYKDFKGTRGSVQAARKLGIGS